MAVRSTCDIARMSRSRNKPENVEIIEYRLEMRRKIDGNIAGVQGVSRIRVQSVCGLIIAWQGTRPMGGWWFQYVNILYIGINFTTFCFLGGAFKVSQLRIILLDVLN